LGNSGKGFVRPPLSCWYQAFRSAPPIASITAGLDAAFIQVEPDLVHTAFKGDSLAVITRGHVLEHLGGARTTL
jgi:hypothetical protein